MKINTASGNTGTVYPGCASGKCISHKIYLELTPPDETDTLADSDRLIRTLKDRMKEIFPEACPCIPVHIPYQVLKRDYPNFRKDNWKVTADLIYTGHEIIIISVESGDTSAFHYGLAVDLGSTTVVMDLLDLNTGEVIAEDSCFNKQIAFGEDILTRIFYTQNDDAETAAQRRLEVQKATTDTFALLMDNLTRDTGIDVSKCSVMTVGGNTTMIHFLYGIDAFCVFMAPFASVFQEMFFLNASDLGLQMQGLVYSIPSAANYLGGDIISGVLAANIRSREEISLYIDIGTNGEMVVGNKDFLVAGAGAAGPALEGGISKFGMRASAGAVDTVTIEDGVLKVTTIGNEKIRGICGSGIVDLLSALLLNGWMDMRGKLVPEKSDRIRVIDGMNVFVYGDIEETSDRKLRYFSEQDIEQFTNTKAAASTMVSCLLGETGITPTEVDHIYTAGSFGKYLNLESAINIGMYPDVDRGKFDCIGNGSLKGACLLLSDYTLLSQLPDILMNMHYLQFATVEDFVPQMQASKFYPHTNLEAYPTVKKRLIANHVL